MDVTKKDQIAQTVKAIIDKHGRIDVLVNNAGVSTMNPIVDITEEEWDFCMNVNAKGSFMVTKAGVAGFEPTTLYLGSRVWHQRILFEINPYRYTCPLSKHVII
jgi:NAD(P)-dependent dehydrogenase (short-subunit alcohol dehydrogenase family)